MSPALRTLLRRINLRHAKTKRLRTMLTIGGIASGVALLFSISIINATLLSTFRSSIRDLAGSAELEVSAPDASGLPQRLVSRVAESEGVERAVPVTRTTTELSGPSGSKRVLVLGVTAEAATLFPRDAGELSRVELSGGFGLGGGLVVARGVAEELGLRQDQDARVQTPSGTASIPVTGTVEGGALALLNGGDVGLMFLPSAQQVFSKPGRVDSIYVVGDPTVPLDRIRAGIEERLGGAAVVGAPGERGQGLERVFSSLATLLSMGGTVALFVAMFVVYNTMAMSLAERRREISMSLALGAARSQVFAAFLAEALVLGVVASGAGLVSGWALAGFLVERAADDFRVLSIGTSGPLVIELSAIAIAAAGGLVVSVAGAYFPARRVLNVGPVESLRPVAAYEWEGQAPGFRSKAALWMSAGGIAAAIGTLIAFLLWPQEKWIVTVGLVFGLMGVTFLLPTIVPLAIGVLRVPLSRFLGPTGRLAGDALAKNPGRSTFTVAALVLTLGLVVGVAGALRSYERQIESTASALIGAPIYVTAKSFTGLSSDQPLEMSLQEDLESVDGVRFVYPLRFALMDLGEQQGLVYAIPVAEAMRAGATSELDAITTDPEAFLATLEKGGTAVSRLTADRLDLEVGDSVRLPTPSGERSFEVGAIFDDLLSFDSFYLDLATYRELWKDDKADEFGVLLSADADRDEVEEGLAAAVARAGAPADVFEKRDLVGRILEMVRGTFELARGIQLAALIVAALTIANTMFTAVLERRWEMGLERALGMGTRQLGRTVLLEAAAIGLIGGLGGVVLGLLTGFFMTQAMEAEFSWRIVYRLPTFLIAATTLGSVALAAAAGLFPSRIAVRTPIIESLRYE